MTSSVKEEIASINGKLAELTAAANLGGYISEDTLCAITGYSYQSVWRLRKAGKLHAKKLGRVRFYKVADLIAELEDAPLSDPPDKK